MTTRLEKLTNKVNSFSECLNNDIYGDGKCLKSPALDEYSVQIPNLTEKDCSVTCQVRETTFYGVEDGNMCYCGNHPLTAEAGTCNVPCEGDSQEICGGMDSTKVFPVKEHGFCFSTSNGDVLHGNLHQNSTDNDFELCQTTCEIDGTAFYGVQGDKCICGDYLTFAEPGTCDVPCPGNPNKVCGGVNAVTVQAVDYTTTENFQSSFGLCSVAKRAQETACIRFGRQSLNYKLEHAACKIACIFSGGCPELNEDCSEKLVFLADPAGWIGPKCATDSPPGTLIKGPPTSSDTMTIKSCLDDCINFKFVGLENGRDCYCGMELLETPNPLPLSQCNLPCSGDENETCGGGSKLQYYENNNN